MSGAQLARMASVWLACCAWTACYGDSGWSGSVPTASAPLFQSTAYPVLMRDCGFSECHGAPMRFFQVFGPGRTRLDPATTTDEPPTAAELQVSYERALSMLTTVGPGDVTQSLLLRKPLELAAGGVGHYGVDDYGRNVYASPQSDGYVALLRWARSGEAASGSSAQAARGSAGGMP